MHPPTVQPDGVARVLCSEAIAVNQNADEGQACLLKCRRWSCDKCLPDLRREVIAKAIDGKPRAMLTLTCDPANYSEPAEAARDMKRALVLLRRHLNAAFGIEKLPFICVFERHKSGWPHMHLLIRGPFIPWKWLSLTWKRLIGAFHVDIRKIHGPTEAARYVAKYIGKEPFAFEGCKRWWRSHNYDLSKREHDRRPRFGFGWRQEAGTIGDFIDELRRTGAKIVESNSRYVHWTEQLPLDAHEILTGKRKRWRCQMEREGT
jgi:hypothetical protein